MSLLDIFRRPSPDETLRALRQQIVIAALAFREHTDESNHQLSTNGAAELLFLLLHLTDLTMYQLLGDSKRAAYIDKLVLETIADYSSATLKEHTPTDVKATIAEFMLRRFNERQAVYAKCSSLSGEGFPSAGTKLFAMCVFIHQALRRTERSDFNALLMGTTKVTESDLRELPSLDHIVKWSAYLAGIMRALKLPREIKKLK